MTPTETKKRSFGEASAQRMPGLACMGRISEVGEGHISQSGKYVVQPLSIEGYGASRSSRFSFLYRPEWLREGFRPDSMEDLEGGNGLLFVYRKQINVRGGISALLGLCGANEEQYDALAGALMDLEEITPETVQAVLETHFLDTYADTKIGYVLRQQKTDTGETDSDGKKIYVYEPYYEVQEFFNPNDEKKLKSLRKRADRSEGKFKVQFAEDDEVAF